MKLLIEVGTLLVLMYTWLNATIAIVTLGIRMFKLACRTITADSLYEIIRNEKSTAFVFKQIVAIVTLILATEMAKGKVIEVSDIEIITKVSHILLSLFCANAIDKISSMRHRNTWIIEKH